MISMDINTAACYKSWKMEIASRARIEILQVVGRMSSCSVKQLIDTGYYSHFLRLRIRSEFESSAPSNQ